MDTILLILALIVLACILYSRRTNRHSRNYHPRWTPPQCDASTQEQSNASAASQADTDMLPYDKAYQRKWLLTMNEKVFYRQLCTFAAKKNMTVFTKVRLLDLLEPVKNQPKYKTYFYKVQAKHVDFVLCDSKLVARYRAAHCPAHPAAPYPLHRCAPAFHRRSRRGAGRSSPDCERG